jgi:hypothetical protein
MADETEDTQPIAARIPQSLLDELDATAERMSRAAFGVTVSRSKVITMALERGVKQLDRELTKREK